MIKKYSLFVFIIITLFSHSQDINFQKNDNSTATELLVVQKLNKNGDSLILESEKLKIRQVDILNDDYFETIKVDSIKTKIGLNELPLGNYVIQARIKKHWIVMYFEKTKNLEKGLNIAENRNKTKLNLVSIEATDLKNDSINSKQNHYKKSTMYWVVYETNSPFSTTKTMSLKYPEEIDNLIAKIKLDVKSKSGENNKLLVYEVYNTSEFMSMQLKNRLYYKKTKSDYFNVIPLYSSED